MKIHKHTWVFICLLFISMVLPAKPVPAMSLQAALINFVSPESCPSGGCAGGQRFNMRSSFDLNTYSPGPADNVQVCAFTPINWAITDFSFSQTGTLSGSSYSPSSSNCGTPPTGYQLSAGVTTALQNQFFGDTLDFVFRLGTTASANGSVYLRIYELSTTGWSQSGQAFIFVPVTPATQSVFVAQRAIDCQSNIPCYINSGDDLPGGVGTGLKDAITALLPGGVIQILGDYPVKSQTVTIDKSLTIRGIQQASITNQQYICDQPMLSAQSGLILENINLNDGVCQFPNRDLLVIESSQAVQVLSSHFSSGRDAILIRQSGSPVQIQASQLSGNSGYAINRLANSGSGSLNVVANNIYNNRSGVQVICNNNGQVDHNFWGATITPLIAAPSCSSTEGKQLGSPILNSVGIPGLQVEKVLVTAQRKSVFQNQISVQHSAGDTDFDLFIVNHGNSSESIPFSSSSGISNLVPCSNYYDVFLADSAQVSGTLNLSLRYDLNNACISNVESNLYCGQSDASQFPLWWFDPTYQITAGWDTTGQAPDGPGANNALGQVTTCNTTAKEISVQIDSTGRPGLNADLGFTPFVVAIVGQTAAAVLTSFSATAGNNSVSLQWQTSSELNTSGYYVQRRLVGASTFSSISPFIPRSGSNTTGASYSFNDTTATNFNVYEYRLEIVGTDFLSVYSNVISASPAPPTQTATVTTSPTVTITPTGSITPTATITPTRTTTRTSTATRTPSRTSYRAPTLVRTTYRSPTPSRTPLPSRTTIFRSTTSPSPSTSTNQTSVVNTTSTQVGSTSGAYPQPDEPELTSDGYPQPNSTPAVISTNQQGTPLVTPNPDVDQTKTSDPSTAGPDQDDDGKTGSSWVYYSLGGVIALCMMLLAGFFLWKKGLFTLPFID